MDSNQERSEEPVKVGDLNTYSRGVNTTVKVVSKTEPREVTSRSDGSAHRVCEALVGDETGSLYLTLWDDAIDDVVEEQVLKITNGYVNLFRGSMRLNIGRYGSSEVVEEAPFEDVNLDNNLSSKQFERPQRGYGRGRGSYGDRDRGRRRY
jgi:replication factor A1